MASAAPSTPAEVLDISTRRLRLKIATAVTSARLFGHWRRPDPGAATAIEEMGLRDISYWVYKCRHPVARPEEGLGGDLPWPGDLKALRLPEGFAPERRASLAAAGDILRPEHLGEAGDRLYERVDDLLFDATLSFANFEAPVTTQALRKEVIGDRAPPVECCSPAQFAMLSGHRDRRFGILNTANNHIFDMGLEGLDTTHRALDAAGIVALGTNQDPSDYGKGRIVTANGIRIGFAAVAFGLNGRTLPEGEAHRVHTARLLSTVAEPDTALVKRQIDHCRAQGCDFIVVSLHWGYEFEFFPRLRQVAVARELVEYGADAILSHHPHVIQPVELYRTRRDPDRVAVIAHSLGSLLWGFSAPHLALSAVLRLELAKGRGPGREATYVERARVTPVFASARREGGEVVTRIERLSDHVDGRRRTFPGAYVARMRAHAERVLGPGAARDA